MASHRLRRQVLLFFAAVLLPCVALLVLGARLVLQERELDRARLDQEQRQLVALLRQQLGSELERTALRQAGLLVARRDLLASHVYGDSAVALVARLSDGVLVLPWQHGDRGPATRRLLEREPFSSRIASAERAEFAAADPDRAAAGYRRALEAAEHPAQEAHARLFLARALRKWGREAEAQALYRELVTVPAVVDSEGVPVSLYAARQLLRLGVADSAVLGLLRRVLDEDRWPVPPTLYLLRDLSEQFIRQASSPSLEQAGRIVAEDVVRKLDRTEHALALKDDLSALGLPVGRATATSGHLEYGPSPSSGTARDTRWVLHGTPPWLVGTAPVPEEQPPLVVAVRVDAVLRSLEAGPPTSSDVVGEVVLAGRDGDGTEPLGAAFSGLGVRFSTPRAAAGPPVGSERWWFYGAGLVLVIGLTLFGAYLLWRDTRREVALAETRSQFVSAVSHELKTPLAAIRMFAESLQMGRPADADARREYLGTIVHESERLTRLLNNVLDFSKIEQDRKTYHRQLTALDKIVRRSARATQYPLEQNGFKLHLDIDEDLPAARVDRDAIEQAILNLLANAMKYSGDSRDIELRLRSENDAAVIEVADRGVGIDPCDQERIFERFHRVPSAANNGAPGAGLGLTLVRHIAEAHGGRVEVESTPGVGSTFALVIPLEDQDACPQGGPSPVSEGRRLAGRTPEGEDS